MKRIATIYTLLYMATAALAAGTQPHSPTGRTAATPQEEGQTTQARMTWTPQGQLAVEWTENVGAQLRSEYSLWLTPMLCNATDTLRLGTEVARGRLNRKRYERSVRLAGGNPDDAPATTAAYDQQTGRLHWQRVIDVPPSMRRGVVDFCVASETEGCCDVQTLPVRQLARTAYVPPFDPLLTPLSEGGVASELARRYPVLHHVSEYRPYDPTQPVSRARGALYVHFPMDSHTVDRDFRGNRTRLDSLMQLTAAIAMDTVSHVSCIQIIGMASPDGPRRRNERLAGRRVKALKDYLQQRVDIPDSIFEVINGGEAWTELRWQIAESDAPYRQQMLDIIDRTADPDRREVLLKQLERGWAYDYLRKHILQDQRYSGYLRVYYDVRPDTVPPIVNRAIRLIRAGQYEKALRTVRTVAHDSRSWNTLGCALYLTGHADEATERLRQAAARGDRDAPRNNGQIAFIAAQRALLEETAPADGTGQPATTDNKP